MVVRFSSESHFNMLIHFREKVTLGVKRKLEKNVEMNG